MFSPQNIEQKRNEYLARSLQIVKFSLKFGSQISSSSDYDRAKDYLEEALEEKDMYVLSDHGRFIAMAIFRMDGCVTTITDLCVVKDKRRSGVARKLISEIQKEEVQPLQFEVPTNNPIMHAFLQAIGYAKILHTTYTK